MPSQLPVSAPARVGVGADESELSELSCWLGPGLVVERGGSERCDVRVIGPAELAAGGARLLRRYRLQNAEVPLVVLVADDAPAALIRDCFRAGAADVLGMGEAGRELAPVLARLLALTRTARLCNGDTAVLAAELGRRARQLESTLDQLEQSYEQTLMALVSALDLREQETADHSMRVALYAVRLAVRVGAARQSLRDLYHGALLHDIGKIGIPDQVLLKPGRLTEEEWQVMRTHPHLGSDILTRVSFLSPARDVPLCHHEAWDGSGYPEGLAGEAIPLHARIFAVVDTYDALRSERPYKPAEPHERAIPLLEAAAGTRLDPGIVACFTAESPQTWARLAAGASSQGSFADALAAAERK